MGHPEEALAGALCALALLAALSGRPGWAGVALGAAVAAKPWAVLAILPALLAADGGRVAPAARPPARRLPPPSCRSCCPSPARSRRHGRDADAPRPTPSTPRSSSGRCARSSSTRSPARPATADRSWSTGSRTAGSSCSRSRSRRCSRCGCARGRVERPTRSRCSRCCSSLRGLLDPWNTIYYVLPAILALVSLGGAVAPRACRSARWPSRR